MARGSNVTRVIVAKAVRPGQLSINLRRLWINHCARLKPQVPASLISTLLGCAVPGRRAYRYPLDLLDSVFMVSSPGGDRDETALEEKSGVRHPVDSLASQPYSAFL